MSDYLWSGTSKAPVGGSEAAPEHPPTGEGAPPGEASVPLSAGDAGGEVIPSAPAAEEASPAEGGGPADRPSAFGLAGRLPRRRGRRLVKPAESAAPLTPEQRLLVLDTWRRSGLPAGDFAALVGLSKHTLYAWKKRFDQEGPDGLVDRPRGGPTGSKLP